MQLSRDEAAEPTEGILFGPAPAASARVSGGWHDRRRTRLRRVLTWGVLVGLGAYLVGRSGLARRSA
jgi:hypothetical protein